MIPITMGSHVRLHATDRNTEPPSEELVTGVVLRMKRDSSGRLDCLMRVDNTKRELWWWADQLEVLKEDKL